MTTYFVKYVGKGTKTISGVGSFLSNSPSKEVNEEVGLCFDTPKEKANGWVVTKKTDSPPMTNSFNNETFPFGKKRK